MGAPKQADRQTDRQQRSAASGLAPCEAASLSPPLPRGVWNACFSYSGPDADRKLHTVISSAKCRSWQAKLMLNNSLFFFCATILRPLSYVMSGIVLKTKHRHPTL